MPSISKPIVNYTGSGNNYGISGIKTFEADIRPEDRFLMERFIQGHIEINGFCQLRAGLLRFTDPVIYPTDFQARFSVLSLDIETGQKGELYSIACHFESRKNLIVPNVKWGLRLNGKQMHERDLLILTKS